MEKNFKIRQDNEIVQKGKSYDLHNFYKLAGISLGINGALLISFKPSPEYGKGHPPVQFEFANIDYLEFSLDLSYECICDFDEMGYVPPNYRPVESLADEEQSEEGYHMFFSFAGENFIRIHSKQVYFRVACP